MMWTLYKLGSNNNKPAMLWTLGKDQNWPKKNFTKFKIDLSINKFLTKFHEILMCGFEENGRKPDFWTKMANFWTKKREQNWPNLVCQKFKLI